MQTNAVEPRDSSLLGAQNPVPDPRLPPEPSDPPQEPAPNPHDPEPYPRYEDDPPTSPIDRVSDAALRRGAAPPSSHRRAGAVS